MRFSKSCRKEASGQTPEQPGPGDTGSAKGPYEKSKKVSLLRLRIDLLGRGSDRCFLVMVVSM